MISLLCLAKAMFNLRSKKLKFYKAFLAFVAWITSLKTINAYPLRLEDFLLVIYTISPYY